MGFQLTKKPDGESSSGLLSISERYIGAGMTRQPTRCHSRACAEKRFSAQAWKRESRVEKFQISLARISVIEILVII
jgi:hypothetical protein